MKVRYLIYAAVVGLVAFGTTANGLLVLTVWRDYQQAVDPAVIASAEFKLGGALVLAVLSTAWVAASLWVTTKRLTQPVAALTETMGELADGRHDIQVPYVGSKDEFGEIADALQVFRDHAVERARLEERERAELEAREERAASIRMLTDGFRKDVHDVMQAVTRSANELNGTAQSLVDSAELNDHRSSNVAAAAEQSSTNVQTVASATEELTASIHTIHDQIAQSNSVAKEAVDEARGTAETVRELSEAVDTITKIVQLIHDIAAQTNLLALNAAVEAARAGEAGRGFAVVANEVKTLSNRVAKATEDIGVQVKTIRAQTEGAVAAIDRIQGVIDEMSRISQEIAAAVDQQSATTDEIARNVHEAAEGARQVTENIHAVSNNVSETRGAARSVSGSASQLSQRADELQGLVGSFIAEVSEA